MTSENAICKVYDSVTHAIEQR